MKFFSVTTPLALAGLSVATVTVQDATASYDTLMQWYNQSIGLWIPSTGWWNSANCLTVVADLALIDPTVHKDAKPIYPNTWVKAQDYDLGMVKTLTPQQLPTTDTGKHLPRKKTKGFLNDYYDDEGWWALAWIAVYDVTGDLTYLETAENIFANMAAAYNTTPCGGLWWDKANTYVNAIANELFLDVAAHLAVRGQTDAAKKKHLKWALEEWNWFQNSGMINSQNLINDGLTNDTCTNNGGTIYTYNQGVILGGLTELSKATGDQSYIATAKTIADAAIANLTDSNGVLHEVCEPDCGADGSQFKGIFARNLQILQQASPEARYAKFFRVNANSIWKNDRNGTELDLVWSGGNTLPANASTQSSAMDAIVGFLATSGGKYD